MNDSDLARLRRLEDRLAIEELTLRYFLANDAGDWATVAGLFTHDIDFAGSRGRGPVVAALSRSWSRFARTMHTSHGVVLEFADDDHTAGVLSAQAHIAMKGRYVICGMRYLDDYRREDGRWLIAKRRIKYLYAAPWEDLSHAFPDDLPVRWPGADPVPPDLRPARSG